MKDRRKIRIDLRKNRTKPPREGDLTRQFHREDEAAEQHVASERVRAKGDLSRRRTIVAEGEGDSGPKLRVVDETACQRGRVIRVHGLQSWVAGEDGKQYRCVVRRVLRSYQIDERNVVVTGDRVWFRPEGQDEGAIERVEPRHGLLTRASRGKEHVMVANVDQVVIVGSLAQPDFKPHLVDRYLASALQGRLQPIVCLNKADLIDPPDYQVVLGLYCQLGIPIVMTSCATGDGMEGLKDLLRGRQTVFAGQSGVGKSSLLNAIQPGLALRVHEVSDVNQKGTHTTTTAELIKLEDEGWVVDTPGIRQFDLWDVIPEEVEGLFPEFRPFIPHCGFPDCAHGYESEECAVREAVRRHRITVQRYESYIGLYLGKLAE